MTSREPVDVARLVKEWLKNDSVLMARFPELVDKDKDGKLSVRVRLELPADWTLGSKPVLMVADDGDTLGMWPAATSPTIRVTSWTSGRQTKYAYAALARLLTAQIRAKLKPDGDEVIVAAVLPGSGFLETRDPKTGGDLISFTVRTRVRQQLPT